MFLPVFHLLKKNFYQKGNLDMPKTQQVTKLVAFFESHLNLIKNSSLRTVCVFNL
jgi:hypothetical protein